MVRSPSVSSASQVSAASTASAVSAQSLSRSEPTSVRANGKMQRTKSGPVGQQNLSRTASFSPGVPLKESDASQTSPTTRKGLSRQRSGTGGRRSRKEVDEDILGDACLFEKIQHEGGLALIPSRESMDFETKLYMKKYVLSKDGKVPQICRETGKDYTKWWEKQQESWRQATVNRTAYR